VDSGFAGKLRVSARTRQFTPSVLSVSVADIYRANETAENIRKTLGENFRVVDWQEANRPLFAALSLERKVAFAVIALIIFVAALNITTTLALLVGERRSDIAVLRTCGARSRSLMTIFLLEGVFLAFAGIFSASFRFDCLRGGKLFSRRQPFVGSLRAQLRSAASGGGETFCSSRSPPSFYVCFRRFIRRFAPGELSRSKICGINKGERINEKVWQL
jgi:cell division protein FtsX